MEMVVTEVHLYSECPIQSENYTGVLHWRHVNLCQCPPVPRSGLPKNPSRVSTGIKHEHGIKHQAYRAAVTLGLGLAICAAYGDQCVCGITERSKCIMLPAVLF